MRCLATFDSGSSCQYQRGNALSIDNLSLQHTGGRILFESARFSLQHGHVTGLVGVNGAGKTSLALLLASKELPGCPKEMSVEYLTACEDEAGDDETRLGLLPLEYMQLRIDERLDGIQSQIDILEDQLEQTEEGESSSSDLCGTAENAMEETVTRLSDLYDLQETLGEKLKREMDRCAQEIGLLRHKDKQLLELSSGWRYKCRLLSTFLVEPDLLIIDEPSFLDDKSLDWFVHQMQQAAHKAKAMVLLISHKEELLETLCDGILYINAGNQTITQYHGSYSSFRATRQAAVQHAERAIQQHHDKSQTAELSLQKLQKQLKGRERNLKATTSKNADQRFVKGKNKEAKQKADRSAASKVKQMKREVEHVKEMKKSARQERVKPIHIDGVPAAGTVVVLRDVSMAFDGEPVFQYVDESIEATDRVLLTGPNGAGKSTLIKIILGEIEPTEGSVTRSGSFLYFPQTALGELIHNHGEETARDLLGRDSLTETQARSLLGDFGLSRDLALRPIGTLSAGQRVRLWLCSRLQHRPEPALLVLDEISENVDIETRQSLVEMLDSFQGAVLVVSHDPDFCQSFRYTKRWELGFHGVRVSFPS